MERGTEIRNQIRRVANIVPRGTAPEEWAAMRKKLRKTNVPKTILKVSPGLKVMVGWLVGGRGFRRGRVPRDEEGG
jgi:hypothetical protein